MSYARIPFKSMNKNDTKNENEIISNFYSVGKDSIIKIMYFADLKSAGCLSSVSHFFNENYKNKKMFNGIGKELFEKKVAVFQEVKKNLIDELRNGLNELGDFTNRISGDSFGEVIDVLKINEDMLLGIAKEIYSLNRCNKTKDILFWNPLTSVCFGAIEGAVIGGMASFIACVSQASCGTILKTFSYSSPSTSIVCCLGFMIHGSYQRNSFYNKLEQTVKPIIQRIYNTDERIKILESHVLSYSEVSEEKQNLLASPKSSY